MQMVDKVAINFHDKYKNHVEIPSFWWKSQPPAWGKALGWVYTQAVRWHSKHLPPPLKAPFPVISIGGLVLGGSGKNAHHTYASSLA